MCLTILVVAKARNTQHMRATREKPQASSNKKKAASCKPWFVEVEDFEMQCLMRQIVPNKCSIGA